MVFIFLPLCVYDVIIISAQTYSDCSFSFSMLPLCNFGNKLVI